MLTRLVGLRFNRTGSFIKETRNLCTNNVRLPSNVECDDAPTGMSYMTSQEYNERYGSKPVWTNYRRNFKGQVPPLDTRKQCIRGGKIATASPCPLCRDEQLLVHYRNTNLLNQFINPFTKNVLERAQSGLCRKADKRLKIAIKKARLHGYLLQNLPYPRKYDYENS